MSRRKDLWGMDGADRMRMRISLPVPPSDNHLYEDHVVTFKRGPRTVNLQKRRLSAEGRTYHQSVRDAIAALAVTSSLEFKSDVQYDCIIRVFFKAVENKGWPTKAKNRYKVQDTTNRSKLVIDIASKVIGVDDSHHFMTKMIKDCDPEDPRLQLTIRERVPRDGD